MVKSNGIYSPQNYVEAVTGNCYIFRSDNTGEEIQKLLKENGYDLWDYPLAEIEHIVENQLNVVLVDVSGFNDGDKWEQEYRWFEVPDDFKEEATNAD